MTNANATFPPRHFGLDYVDGRYRVVIANVNPQADFLDTTDSWHEAAKAITAALVNPEVVHIRVSMQDLFDYRPAEPLLIYQWIRQEDGLCSKVTERTRKLIADSVGGPQEWRTL